MLIALQHHHAGRGDEEELLYPVLGRPGDPNPTTRGVYLYTDPATKGTPMPLLFADCEGLDARDKTPTALSFNITGSWDQFWLLRQRARRRIPWKEQQKREEAVMDLFPKILYTVSSVVVFVLKEAM